MSGDPNAVVVTGCGLVSAAGDSPAALGAALERGTRPFLPPSGLPDSCTGGRWAAEVRDFDPRAYLGPRNLRPLDRTGQLAASAVALALDDAGWTAEARQADPVGLVFGTTYGSVHTIAAFDRRAQTAGPEYASPLDFANTVINAPAGQVAIWHDLRGVNTTVAAGAASGLLAIAYAARLIRSGQAGAIVAGGADELCAESFGAFARAGWLAPPGEAGADRAVPFDRRRAGFVLGEGAAFVVIESLASARARGARVRAVVGGAVSGYLPAAGAASAPMMAELVGRALARSGWTPADLDAVSAAANGGASDDAVEARALASAFIGAGRPVPVTAHKSVTGELLGASGAVQVVAALHAFETGRLPGIAGLELAAEETRGLAVLGPGGHEITPRRVLVLARSHEGNCGAVTLGV